MTQGTTIECATIHIHKNKTALVHTQRVDFYLTISTENDVHEFYQYTNLEPQSFMQNNKIKHKFPLFLQPCGLQEDKSTTLGVKTPNLTIVYATTDPFAWHKI